MRGFVALAAVTLLVGVAAVVNDMDRDTILDRYTVTGSYMCWWWARTKKTGCNTITLVLNTFSRQTRWSVVGAQWPKCGNCPMHIWDVTRRSDCVGRKK